MKICKWKPSPMQATLLASRRLALALVVPALLITITNIRFGSGQQIPAQSSVCQLAWRTNQALQQQLQQLLAQRQQYQGQLPGDALKNDLSADQQQQQPLYPYTLWQQQGRPQLPTATAPSVQAPATRLQCVPTVTSPPPQSSLIPIAPTQSPNPAMSPPAQHPWTGQIPTPGWMWNGYGWGYNPVAQQAPPSAQPQQQQQQQQCPVGTNPVPVQDDDDADDDEDEDDDNINLNVNSNAKDPKVLAAILKSLNITEIINQQSTTPRIG